ncbi:hypothetical protein PT2222_90128 [Paraburkholderia tropica]
MFESVGESADRFARGGLHWDAALHNILGSDMIDRVFEQAVVHGIPSLRGTPRGQSGPHARAIRAKATHAPQAAPSQADKLPDRPTLPARRRPPAQRRGAGANHP